MADYYPLIANAVAALERNTGENRRALYERARTALVAQLRGVQPSLEESEITRERLALEEAIRKIEGEAARRAREEARLGPTRRSDPTARRDPQRSMATPTADAGPRPPGQRRSLSDEALKGFRDTGTPAAPRPGRPRPGERSAPARATMPEASLLEQQQPYDEPSPHAPPEELLDAPLEPPAIGEEEAPARPARSKPPRQVVYEDDAPPRRGPGGGMIVLLLLLLLIGIISGLGWWHRNAISEAAANFIAWVRAPKQQQQTQQQPQQPQQQTQQQPQQPPQTQAQPQPQVPPKNTDRLGPGPAPQPGAQIAQRVVLYEEDPADPQGKRLQGTAVWSLETLPAAPGRPAEVAVRAKIDIPERQTSVTFSLRRNTDQSLPASHTIEIMFNLPPDAPSGGVQNVPGVLMKQSEQTRGVPLAGLAVKVTPGYFLIGLSSLETDMQRNMQLLKERSWFDIPIVYNNNRRAILALEKGIPGEKAFNEAFAAWQQ